MTPAQQQPFNNMTKVTSVSEMDSFGSGHGPVPGSLERGNVSSSFPAKHLLGP